MIDMSREAHEKPTRKKTRTIKEKEIREDLRRIAIIEGGREEKFFGFGGHFRRYWYYIWWSSTRRMFARRAWIGGNRNVFLFFSFLFAELGLAKKTLHRIPNCVQDTECYWL